MTATFLSILTLCAIGLAAFGLGRAIVRALRLDEMGDGGRCPPYGTRGRCPAYETVVWSFALGLLVWGLGLAVLGLVGWLYGPAIRLLTLAADAVTLVWMAAAVRRRAAGQELQIENGKWQMANWRAEEAPRWRGGASRAVRTQAELGNEDSEEHREGPPKWLSAVVFGAAAVAAIAAMIGALAPATAGDALCYHLELPKTFLREHRLVYLPLHENSTFPLLAEMLFAWALAWSPSLADGGVAANLVSCGLGLLLAGSATVLARPIVGRRWAALAGAAVLLTPGVTNQMTAALNDVALAVYCTLALAAWRRALHDESPARWFMAAGLAAAGALSVKYVAVLFAVAMAAAWLVDFMVGRRLVTSWSPAFRRQEPPAEAGTPTGDRSPFVGTRRLLWQGAGVVAVIAVSVAGLWYVRAAWHRGNPVYPFLAEKLAGPPGSGSPGGGPVRAIVRESKRPLSANPADVVSAPWRIAMEPERFGGRGHQLGAAYLAVLPGLVLTGWAGARLRRHRGLATLAVVAGTYFACWYALRQNVRFLFPIVPLLATGIVAGLAGLRIFPALPRALALIAAAGLLAAGAAFPVKRAIGALPPAAGLEDRGAWLAEHEPSYPAACFAGKFLPPTARILSQDYRLFYFQQPATRENVFREVSSYADQVSGPGDLPRLLRRAGFTHVLLAEVERERAGDALSAGDDAGAPQRLAGAKVNATLSRLADAELSSPSPEMRVVLDYQATDPDGCRRRYRLVELCGAAAGAE
ncbi:MAG: glycosyltransferase family 39 protein [Planctomycetia bacterium]|nr:glycosyltransferase family 39 protein [Planctomycetia bacterium]